MEGMELVTNLLNRFMQFETIELTQEEELAVLAAINPDDELDHGTSRVVYALGDYVVKIAMSVGGVTQNKTEYKFYKDYCRHGVFANLYAHGKMINIMERLDDCDYYELERWWDEEDEDEWEFNTRIDEVINTANDLTDYSGGDNGQIGYSQLDDCYKLYDYGYSNGFSRSEMVDNVGAYKEATDPIENAIDVVNGMELPSQEELYARYRNSWEEESEEDELCQIETLLRKLKKKQKRN